MDELFLEGVGKVVLRTEEDNTTLRYWSICQSRCYKQKRSGLSHTRNGNIAESFISVLAIKQIFNDVNVEELSTNDRGSILVFELIQSTRKLQRLWVLLLRCLFVRSRDLMVAVILDDSWTHVVGDLVVKIQIVRRGFKYSYQRDPGDTVVSISSTY